MLELVAEDSRNGETEEEREREEPFVKH